MNPSETTAVQSGSHLAPPPIGDNVSKDAEALRAIGERVERHEEERKTLRTDVLRTFARMRMMSPNDRAEHETALDIYMAALGF